MQREEIYVKLNEIFCDVFDDDSLKICDSTTSNDIEDWDSLEQIHLIVGIEKKFNIKFDIKEITGLKNVGEMVDIILKKV